MGAGPAGNNAALTLARQGYSVTVIDWRQNLGDKLCTGIV
ncbi:MAG: NAD(P)/FAD-dependent oxidoreductase, partial [Dehalococcoidia bacterium]